jgi:hypothetical protein
MNLDAISRILIVVAVVIFLSVLISIMIALIVESVDVHKV